MIEGTVNGRRAAVVKLCIHGLSGAVFEFPFIVDTGFTGTLTLPISDVASLGLPWKMRSQAALANGLIHRFDVYTANVVWEGRVSEVLVSAMGDEALMGMSLMSGHELRIEMRSGGRVRLLPLP